MNKQKEELILHLRDIIEDSKNSLLPIEVSLERYADSLLRWFEPELEILLKSCGDRFRKLTLHSENPKRPKLIWQATPNQHKSLYFKKGVRGETPSKAVFNLLQELKKNER